MSRDGSGSEPVRELKLEGPGLWLAGAVLIALIVGAFVAGRGYERGLHPASGAASGGSASAGAAGPERQSEVDSGNYFDTVEGEGKAVEPGREVPAEQETTDAPRTAEQSNEDPTLPPTDGGEFWVQVFAGRDESTAASLVRKLEAAGHRVRLHTEREGSGALYKVRVGSWSEHDTAGRAAETLKSQGYTGAWVTRVTS
jgi:cell division septation protein DedD